LSVTRCDDEREGPHPESRLVREEDELGEGDDGTLISISIIRYNNTSVEQQNLLNIPVHWKGSLWARNRQSWKRNGGGML
jgi:hypothetical protein